VADDPGCNGDIPERAAADPRTPPPGTRSIPPRCVPKPELRHEGEKLIAEGKDPGAEFIEKQKGGGKR